MNISTYEARIKALENQLNPPAPSGSGIVSVTVTPDITLNNGTTLNAWLSETMPIATGEKYYDLTARDALVNDSLYEVNATPGGNWCMNTSGSGFGQPGLNKTGTATVTDGQLEIDIISASDPQDQTAPFARLKVIIAGGE